MVWGTGLYVWLAQPKRLVARYVPETRRFTILHPQPLRVPLNTTNVFIIDPPDTAYLNGIAANAAVWANGRSFNSAGQAAWILVSGAWPLCCVCVGTLFCWGLLIRRERRLNTKAEANE